MQTTPPAPTGRRRPGTAVLAVLASVGVLGLGTVAASPASADAGDPCARSGDISLPSLEQWRQDRACDLVGRTVRAGRAAVIVPPRGSSVRASLLFVDGDEELTVTTAADGTVTASTGPESTGPESTGGAGTLAAAATPAACSDNAYNLMGMKWPAGSTYAWYYHPANQTRSKLTAADALAATKNATVNVVTGHNDCGLAAQPKVYQSYRGTTTVAPGVTNAGGCSASDGRNVSGWGNMGTSGLLGVTCDWATSGTIVESDLKVNFNYSYWNGQGTCPAGYFDYQSVATHERGHTFGLGHVDGTAHPKATMTPAIGPCDKSKRTLSAGEHAALIEMYGRR